MVTTQAPNLVFTIGVQAIALLASCALAYGVWRAIGGKRAK